MKHYKPSGGKAKKRLLALVLAMAVICSSLVSVYANGVATMDMGFGVDTGFGVDVQMDDGFAVDTQDESADYDLAPGVTESVDKDGNIVYTWDKDTYIDWTDDDAIASPYPDGEQMDPGFAIPTNTYRFWLTNDETKRAAADVEIASAMKLYDMTAYDATEMYGPLYGMYTLVAIADGGTMSDNTVLNPTSADAPDASKPYFAGWYTLDEFGYEQEFLFDHSTVSVAKSATVDVFAKWTAVKSAEAAQPNEDLAAEQTYERWFAQLISCSDSAFNDLIDRYLQDAGFEEWLNNLPEDELQYLSDRMDSFVETIPTERRNEYSVTLHATGKVNDSYPKIILTTTYNKTSGSYTWNIEQGNSNYKAVNLTSSTTSRTATVTAWWAGTATVTCTYTYRSGTSTYTQTDVFNITVTATYSVKNTIEDAEVVCIHFTPETAATADFRTVASGETVELTASNGCWMFFVKPKDGYLLTQYKAIATSGENKSYDLYGVQVAAKDTNILYFKNTGTNDSGQTIITGVDPDGTKKTAGNIVMARAADMGYVGYYAFTFEWSTGAESHYEVKGEIPPMTVVAVAEPNENIKPNDEVTFTVVVTPGHTKVADEVTDVRLTSLTINGVDYKDKIISTEVDEATGVRTYKVKYTVTEEDWQNKKVALDVSAEIDYEYIVGVSDRTGYESSVPSEATVNGKATTDVEFAIKNGVVYKVNFDPADKADTSLFPKTPTDEQTYFAGEDVTVESYLYKGTQVTENTRIDDPENGGYWTFDGWYANGDTTKKLVGETVVMPNEGSLLFVGTWTFAKYPNTTVTITKEVTGFFGERSKDFAFTVIFTDGTDTRNITATKDGEVLPEGQTWSSFTLKNGESVVLSGVPIDAQITVKETDADDYDVSAKVDGEPVTVNATSHSFDCKVKAPADGKDQNHITVTNHKSAVIDAGIDLGSATPYLFLLCVGAVGVATLRRKRRG